MSAPRLPSSLAPHVARPASSEFELLRLRRAAFHQHGIVVLRLADVADDRLRRRLAGEAERLYGATPDPSA
ncbi:MAG: hypothetical protein RIM84_07190 [Alphaproteobacteria bacterium]